MNNFQRDIIIVEWMELKKQISQLSKDAEKLQLELLKELHGYDPNSIQPLADGSLTTELGNDWKLKATFKSTVVVNDDQENGYEKFNEVLDGVRALNESTDGLFRHKTELSRSAYKALSPEAQTIVNAILTTKPVKPTLELVPPKGYEG